MRNVGYCEMYTGRKISKINITWHLLFPTFRNVGVYIDILMELVILKIDYNLHEIKNKIFRIWYRNSVKWKHFYLCILFLSILERCQNNLFSFHICIVKHMKNSDAIAIHTYCIQPYYIRFKIYYEHKFFI